MSNPYIPSALFKRINDIDHSLIYLKEIYVFVLEMRKFGFSDDEIVEEIRNIAEEVNAIWSND